MGKLQRLIANSTFKKGIVIPSLAFILSVSFISSFFPNRAAALLGEVQRFIFTNLNWVYIWAVTLFV